MSFDRKANGFVLRKEKDYIQYPLINHNGEEYEKDYVYITASFCCTAEINTTLQINYTVIIFFKKLRKEPKREYKQKIDRICSGFFSGLA